MKHQTKSSFRLISLLLCAALLLGVMLLFCSCGLSARRVVSAKVSAGGELVLTYSDGSIESVGKVISDGLGSSVDYTVQISGEAEDVAAAASSGLLSR